MADRRLRPSRSVGGSLPLVSVIVTTYTDQRLNDVRDLLESLQAQTYPHFETVFVGEKLPQLCDRVSEYAARLGMSNFRAEFNDGAPGLSHARNLGVERSSGQIAAFIDDDALARPDWLENVVRALTEHPEAIGVTGPAYPLWASDSLRWFPEEFFWILSCPTPGWTGHRRVGPIRNAWGMNMAFRREAFDYCRFSPAFVGGNQGAADGSKTGLLGDETEFCLRLTGESGRSILYSPDVQVLHKVYEHRLSGRFIRRRAFWEGYTKAALGRLHRGQRAGRLSPEIDLLRLILFRYFPREAAQCLLRPALGWRRLSLGVSVLMHVALGYGAGRFPGWGRLLASRYSSSR